MFEYCMIYHNTLDGILVDTEGDLVVEKSLIAKNRNNGIDVLSDGRTIVKDSRILRNKVCSFVLINYSIEWNCCYRNG